MRGGKKSEKIKNKKIIKRKKAEAIKDSKDVYYSTESKSNIYQKIYAIQKAIVPLNKKELNKFQNYYYFNEYQVLNQLRPLLKEEGLVITFTDCENDFTCQKQEKDYLVQYRKQAILTNIIKPEEQLVFNLWAVGSNQDPAKAKGSAETYAMKYFLSKFFLMPVQENDDPDHQTELNVKKEFSFKKL